MVKTGLQLYSVHDVDDSTATVLDRVAETDLDGVEFFELDDPDAVAAALDRTGLDVAGAHVGLESLEDDFEATVETWASVGVTEFVVPWADPEHFESRSAVESLADRLNEVADRLAEHGHRLHYHNHDQEFAEIGGRPAFEVLAEAAPSVGLEIDLGWVGVGGADPLSYVDRYADRVSLLHVKDYDAAGGSAKVGEGDLDLDGVAAKAREQDVEWLIYEYEGGTDTYDTVDHAGEVMPPLVRRP